MPFIFIGGGSEGGWGSFSPLTIFFFGGGGHNPHFCRIINNFLNFTTFNSLGLKNTILESSSTRLVCFGQQTTYVVSWFGTFHFFICTPSPPPPWKAILFSFWCRHHWRLHPRGKNVVGVFKKKITKTSFYCLWGRGVGEEMEWPILIWAPFFWAPFFF